MKLYQGDDELIHKADATAYSGSTAAAKRPGIKALLHGVLIIHISRLEAKLAKLSSRPVRRTVVLRPSRPG